MSATDLEATGKTGRVLARQLCLLDDPGCTDEEQTFADAYLANGFSPADAYIAVKGPDTKRGTARKMGAEWLRRDAVRAYIEQRRTEAALEAGLTREEVIAYLRTVVLMGTGRMKVRRSVQDKEGQPDMVRERFEPSLSAAHSAASTLAKFVGVGAESDGEATDSVRRIEVQFVAPGTRNDGLRVAENA